MTFENWQIENKQIEPDGFETWKAESIPEVEVREQLTPISEEKFRKIGTPWAPTMKPSAIDIAAAQIVKEAYAAPVRTVESMMAGAGGLIRMGYESATIGEVITKRVNIPGASIIAESLVRKYGPKRALSFYDARMKQYAGAGKKISDFWEEQANKGWEAPNPDITEARWRDRPVSKTVSAVSSGLTSIGIVVGTTFLTKSPHAGLAVLAGSETGSMYDRLRAKDVPPGVASKLAQMAGAWTYVTEKIGFKHLLTPGKKTIMAALRKGGWEGGQEVIEQMGHNLLEYFGYDYKDLKSIPTAVRAAFDHIMDNWVDALVGGIGAGGIAHLALPGARPGIQVQVLNDAGTQIEQSNVSSQQKEQALRYIGDIETEVEEQIVNKFPEKINNRETLRNIGNQIAEELGVEGISWQWGTTKKSLIAYYSPPKKSITINPNHSIFKADIADFYSKRGMWIPIKNKTPGELNQDYLKRVIVHELGHRAKPSQATGARLRKTTHYAEFFDWVNGGIKNLFEQTQQKIIPLYRPEAIGPITVPPTIEELTKKPIEEIERATAIAEPITSEQAIGQQYGLDNEKVDIRLAQAEGRYRELKQKETTDRTIKETKELTFLKKNRTDIESLLEWDTVPGREKVKEQPRQKPYKSQYIAGHEIPKVLGMEEGERRKFMKKETGETSMADMTPNTAQDYINALHKLAREKGIDTGVLPPERVFRKPIIGLTPQLYKAKILGVEFMVKPATIGKQKFDLEFAKEARQVDKMEQVINRLGGETIKTKATAKLKNKQTKSMIKFAELLNKYEEPPTWLPQKEKDVFNYYRNLNRSIIIKENEVREELGMELIEYKPGYMRHIVDPMVRDIMEGRHPIPEELKYWAEKHATIKIRNPMEFQRKLGDELEDIFSNDLTRATKAMLWTGLQEIHLNKPLKHFETQMGLHSEVIPDSTRRWAEEFINHMIVGKQTATDQRLNDMVRESGIGRVINKILRPFGRRISNKPFTNLMGKAGRLQIYGVMGWRPKQLIRNKFQFLQNLALYTTKANLKSFLPASEQLKGLMDESLFLKTYKGFEDLTEVDKRTLGRLWLAPFQWTAVTNANRAMKVAYYDTLELIEDSKYKDLGWADSERTYTEEKDFLYPSEKEKLLAEMEFGAGITQYHYIPMAMPGVFKYKIATPLTRLQSWWMNYFFKFHRESAHRFFKGETREGLKLPWSRRVGWGRYMIIGGVVLNTLGYTSSYLFGAAPEAVPPLAQLLISLYKYIVTQSDRVRASAKRKFLYALKTFIPGYLAAKDISVLLDEDKSWTELLFYHKGIFAEEEEEPARRGGISRPGGVGRPAGGRQ